jgi:predicted DNA-binding transcriptional regulator AlpA
MEAKPDARAALATVVVDPERIADLSVDALAQLIGETEVLRARLLARLIASATAPPPPPGGPGTKQPDTLLTAAQAAERLGVDRRWVYRMAPELPFTRRLSTSTLRFSARGLERWTESRR